MSLNLYYVYVGIGLIAMFWMIIGFLNESEQDHNMKNGIHPIKVYNEKGELKYEVSRKKASKQYWDKFEEERTSKRKKVEQNQKPTEVI